MLSTFSLGYSWCWLLFFAAEMLVCFAFYSLFSNKSRSLLWRLMVFHELELSMVLLDPWHILWMVLIEPHILVRVRILFHWVCFVDNDHSWSCRCIVVSLLDYSIVYLLGHWVSYFQDGLWLDDTIWRWDLSIHLVVLFPISWIITWFGVT